MTEAHVDVVQVGNGATLLVEQDVTLAEVALAVHVDTGYRADPEESSGLSHLVEHLLFDVDMDAPFSYGRFVVGRGGRLNAQTFESHTAFWTVAPPDSLDQVVEFEQTRWSSFDIREQTFEQHVDSIVAEVQSRRAAPFGGFPWPDAAFLPYGDTPFGRDGLGTQTAFARMTPAQARAHHQAWYTHPEDMVVAVCGPHPPEEVMPALVEAFEALPSSPKPSAPLLAKAFRGGTARVTAEASRVPQPAEVAFLPIPTVDQDIDAGLAAVVLGEALLTLLRNEFPSVRFSSSAGMLGALTAREGDVLVITALGGKDTVELLHGAAARLVSSPAFDAVLPEARARAHARLAALTTEIESRATMLARVHAFLGASTTMWSLAERISHATGEQIRAVAERAVGAAVGILTLTPEPVR